MLKKKRTVAVLSLLSICAMTATAQDNSPYSRYGLGDIAPLTNITSRGMGGISAAYADVLSVNFNNPASYSRFQTQQEARSKKLATGRVIFDVGMNIDNRTLIEPGTTNRFSSSDAMFSYIQIGVPLRKNWGLSFGLRPLSRISYNIARTEFLKDPITADTIGNATTQFRGSGGSYLPSIGTGFGLNLSPSTLLSAGVNMGYLFGRRESQTLRNFNNDSVLHYASEHNTKTYFGDIFFNAGLQLETRLNSNTVLRLGAAGNWQQDFDASRDILRQTFVRGAAGEILELDSVQEVNDIKGTVIYPASYKFGFVVQSSKEDKGWLIGADYTMDKWNKYRFFGTADSVQDSWSVNVGGQFYPRQRSNYFSKLIYRFGFNFGKDYIRVTNDLPTFGASFGVGIPVRASRTSINQMSRLNLALEYGKRGNNDNLLKENLFRASVSFNLTDLWFIKRKYD
ncbi:MAG: hypothetical protein ACXWB9_03050 [Flavisolibacter sp.]